VLFAGGVAWWSGKQGSRKAKISARPGIIWLCGFLPEKKRRKFSQPFRGRWKELKAVAEEKIRRIAIFQPEIGFVQSTANTRKIKQRAAL
jgi:hypothetical protein